MSKVNQLIDLISKNNLSEANNLMNDIFLRKVETRLQEKRSEIVSTMFVDLVSIEEADKNPARIKNAQAEKLLKKFGYSKIRSGEHQSIWKHMTDKTKELFPLPHHSKELSPGLTRKLFSLSSEPVLEQENAAVLKLRKHIRTMHPHYAREKNLADREKFDKQIDAIERKRIPFKKTRN